MLQLTHSLGLAKILQSAILAGSDNKKVVEDNIGPEGEFTESFNKSFDRVFTNEGAFQNNRDDRGNWTTGVIGKGKLKGTKFGLAAMTYPDLDIRNITLLQAKRIYKRDWWDKLGMALLPVAFQYQMFDAAINHGMHNATEMVQRAADTPDDGVIGPNTRAAIGKVEINDLLMGFLAERLEFMTYIGSWGSFGKGWARRIAHNLRMATLDN
jgi:lysozyme family protein